jgi:hypothetical protein
MVLVAQKWNKIAKYLHVKTKSKTPRNGKICKDKWNSINGDYKRFLTTTKVHATTPLIGIYH